MGIVAFGGCALGLFSIGGFALALIVAYGGFAVGPIAYGGFAAGYLAMGGAAFGVHHAGGNGADATGAAIFRRWALVMQAIFYGSWVVFIPAMILSIYARIWALKKTNRISTPTQSTQRPQTPQRST